MIEKITKKKIENQKDAKKKLIWVSIICIFFMAVETVGGYLSGSISIWSDAARKSLVNILILIINFYCLFLIRYVF
jgi:Co/Zn/Cd efflux system component